MWKRVFAVVGTAWIVGVVGFLLLGTNTPALWKLAWAEYGGIGLVHMLGIWRGRDQDDNWDRRMRLFPWVGLVVAMGLFLVGALLDPRYDLVG